jgi:hypothetical protein
MRSLLRIIKILITFLCWVTMILFPLEYTDHKTHAATKDEILDAHVRIDVEWNNYNPGNGNISQTGFFFVEVKGTIIRMPDIDPFFYAPKNLVANYNYQDRGVYVRPSGRCPELYSEQKGSGAVHILHTDEVEDPTKDGQLSVMAGPGWEQSLLLLKELQSKGRTSARQKPIDKELKTDVYQFVLTVPMATTLKQQSTPCSRYETIPFPTGVALNPYLYLPKWGMYGSYSWTSNDLDTGLQIRNYPGQTQFGPQKGEGNVKYRVSWSFGKIKPMIQIFRITDEGREDITDSETDILVGQKVKIEAVAVPYGDTGKGRWDIPSPVIADFKAYLEEGKMLPLDDGKKMKPTVEFFFTDGDFAGKPVTLTYTTYVDNKEVKGKTTFKVYEPSVSIEVHTSPSVNIHVLGMKTGGKPSCRLYLGDVARGVSGIKIKSKIRLPALFADLQHSHWLEYIQLIKEDILEYHDADYWHTGTDKWLLDTHYPYLGLVAEGEIEVDDLPGSDLGELTRELHQYQTFKTFLMFRPSKKAGGNSVWVPLKVVEWDWKASAISKNQGPGNRNSNPPQPSDFNLVAPRPPSHKIYNWTEPPKYTPESYPQWTANVAEKTPEGNSKWRSKLRDWPQRLSDWNQGHAR